MGFLTVERVSRFLIWPIATLVLVSIITFLATNLTGIDAARAALGRLSSAEQIALFSEQQGLGLPIAQRYAVWLWNVLHGDWGISLQAKIPATDLVVPRAGRSAILALISLSVAVPIAFILGALAALRPGGRFDTIVSSISLLVIGLPEFVVGLGFLYFFAVWMNVLPPNSTAVATGSGSAVFAAYVLPTLTLTLLLIPYILRMARSAFREVMAAPYIQSAIARGVPTTRLLLRHALPNTLGSIINVVALSLAEVLAGVVMIETVFAFPGLGQLTVFAVSTVDYAVIQACVMISAAGFVAINLAADVLVVVTNPRLRRGRQ